MILPRTVLIERSGQMSCFNVWLIVITSIYSSCEYTMLLVCPVRKV